ncbi:MAG: hypothetical protein DRQ62_09905 [Gammaproteobacteria bacterium]|nr:MAG: hypothetical protein DRQ62_09905 [Gammaproteobacteria bacterium]
MTTPSEDLKICIQEAETLRDGIETLSTDIPYHAPINQRIDRINDEMACVINELNAELEKLP